MARGDGLVARCMSSIMGSVTLAKDYRTAVEGYLTASGGDTQTAGTAIKTYLKDLWSAFILVNVLLIGASMTAFAQAATQASTARGQPSLGAMMPNATYCTTLVFTYSHETFGIFWSATLSLNCCALTIAMLLLGYLLAYPEGLIYNWARTKANGILGLPALMTLLGTLAFMASVTYSAAVYYGLRALLAVLAIFVLGIVMGLWGVFAFSEYEPAAPAAAPTAPSSGVSSQGSGTGSGSQADVCLDLNDESAGAGSRKQPDSCLASISAPAVLDNLPDTRQAGDNARLRTGTRYHTTMQEPGGPSSSSSSSSRQPAPAAVASAAKLCMVAAG